MNERQAKRIETLLRYHSIQLHHLLVQLVEMTAYIVPAEAFKDDKFKKMTQDKINDSSKMILDLFQKLNKEIRDEGGSEPDIPGDLLN
ncbi:MAG: hypothetical protein ACJ79H_02445 [Myxococcales bacterium]